ncbi:RNA-directed DNA polymerase, eukaryota, reverse transcriptase zinc-binding domain protein [Tanacetum coccineum]
MVCDEKGKSFKGNKVAEQFVKHFQRFLGNAHHVEDWPKNGFNVTKFNRTDAEHMVRPVLDAEVKDALYDICENKAPGPNVYTSKFYKKAWSIVGKDVCYAVKEFFSQRKITWSAAFSICVNGERNRYFKGGRGLRQGDPMSPYIFTLGCKDLEITHLCFADDFLVLCHGDMQSVKVVKKALDSFSALNGLVPNLGKGTIFFSNLEESIINEILEIMPFKIGKLPVFYLGVPLITKQIGVNECKCLIDKVKAKVNNSKNKMLSYAGRLLKGLLWCQGDLSKGKSKVTWKQICRPKNEGGLGIKNLCDRNESIWEVKCNANSSSGWKNLLSLRVKIKKHVKYKIGNEKSIFLWHDKWWDGGILNEVFPFETLPNVESKVKISEMIQNGKWLWPEEWIVVYPNILNISVPSLSNMDDKAYWMTSHSDVD